MGKDSLPEANEEGEVGLRRDAWHDDAAVGVAVGEGLGHQHMAARQVPWGPTALSQAPMRHLHNTVIPLLVHWNAVCSSTAASGSKLLRAVLQMW